MPINNMTKEDLDYTVCEGEILPDFGRVPARGCVDETLVDTCVYTFTITSTGEECGAIQPSSGDTLITIRSCGNISSGEGSCGA